MIDFQLLLRMVDECIIELGTSSMVDGVSARDKLLDIRSLVMSMIGENIVPTPQ